MIHVGTSGWRYAEWRGGFYPRGLPHRRELEHIGRSFDTVEVNGSFYSLLRPRVVEAWCEEVPERFLFAVKGSRFITHMKQLGDVRAPLANFFASGVLAFGAKLGPILWQLPPRMRFDSDKVARFLDRLPRTTSAAARLAREHDARLEGRAFTRALVERPIRYALEVRHPSFEDPSFARLLRERGVALCIADTANLFPSIEVRTCDFTYVRLHGDTELYASRYEPPALERWATRVRRWARAGDVFVYFDNDARGHAPLDARALAEMVKGTTRASNAR